MANLREIQRRMSSIKSTMQITRTMEMISTARIRRALEKAEQAEPYKDAVTRMLANVASAGFDVEHELERLAEQGINSSVITCGRKPTEYFTFRKVKPAMSFVGISSEPNMDEADRIASFVMEGYAQGAYDRVVLCYWHAKNRVEQTQVTEQLLPITKEQLTMPNKPRTPDPSPEEVLGQLLPAYFRTVIFHALLDSAAAEHGARRRAMQSATDNANEVLGTLSRTYNRERQGAITTELNEIIGGASALEDY